MTLLHKIHSNIIHVRPKREQSKCLSIGKWIKKIYPYKQMPLVFFYDSPRTLLFSRWLIMKGTKI